jgi:aryl-alcohol dehydrogenase-like predicted oxidoreductase
LTARTIRDSLEASLKALGTDHVDLFQLHAFDETTPLDETFSALDSVVREGKVRFIGCSNYEGWQLERVADLCSRNKLPSFVTAQAHFNLIERRAAREVLPVCARQGISGLINRPLARGILTGKYKWDQPLPSASRAAESLRVRKWLEEGTLRLVADLEDWAKGRGRTMPQLALAWLFAQKDVGAALVGVRNSDQLDDCLKAADWELVADLKEVDGLIEKHGLTAQVHERPPALFEK